MSVRHVNIRLGSLCNTSAAVKVELALSLQYTFNLLNFNGLIVSGLDGYAEGGTNPVQGK